MLISYQQHQIQNSVTKGNDKKGGNCVSNNEFSSIQRSMTLHFVKTHSAIQLKIAISLSKQNVKD